MKLEVGSKVLVRKDLVVGKHYDECLFIESMEDVAGKECTISEAVHRLGKERYILEELPSWHWSAEMFEEAKEKTKGNGKLAGEVEDKVKSKNKVKPIVHEIKHIISGTTTIVMIDNKYKGIAKLSSEDEFSELDGFLWAYLRAYKLACIDLGKDVGDFFKEAMAELFKDGSNVLLKKVTKHETKISIEDIVKNNIAVNCRTEEEAMEYLAWLQNLGATWNSGALLSSCTYYSSFGEDTVYTVYKSGLSRKIHVLFNSTDTLKARGVKIVLFSDIEQRIKNREVEG